MIRLSLWMLFVVFPAASSAHAQDVAEEAKKQRQAAEEGWKRATLGTPVAHETTGLIVFSSLPAAQLKTVAESGQKAFDLARKALQYEATDRLWTGKLTVLIFANRDDYAKYIRKVVQDKPSATETLRINIQGTEPTAILVLTMTKTAADDLIAEMTTAVSTALLKHRSGATTAKTADFDLPDWIAVGFSKNIHGRLDGHAAKLTGYRTKAKQAIAKTPKVPMPPVAMSLWSGERPKEFDALAFSLVEYLAFGPEAMRFNKFLAGFRPTDDRTSPTTAQALELLELKPDALDKAWKAWIVKGK